MSNDVHPRIDPEVLRAKITADVVDALTPLLTGATEPRLVSRERMAELLSVSIPTLDRLTSAGVIPSVVLGARRLYEPAAVIRAVTTNKKGAADA